MAVKVNVQTIGATAEEIDLGPRYNDREATILVEDATESVFVGGPDVDTADAGYEWVAGSEHQVILNSGSRLYAIRGDATDVDIKILNTGN